MKKRKQRERESRVWNGKEGREKGGQKEERVRSMRDGGKNDGER